MYAMKILDISTFKHIKNEQKYDYIVYIGFIHYFLLNEALLVEQCKYCVLYNIFLLQIIQIHEIGARKRHACRGVSRGSQKWPTKASYDLWTYPIWRKTLYTEVFLLIYQSINQELRIMRKTPYTELFIKVHWQNLPSLSVFLGVHFSIR